MPRPGIPDPFRMRARAEGYVARAVYKLKEIDAKYRLFRKGDRVLDLGCSPGSWLQYIAAQVGPRGLVLGVDAAELAIPVAPPLYFIQGEVGSLDLETLAAISPAFDVVVSDLSTELTMDMTGKEWWPEDIWAKGQKLKEKPPTLDDKGYENLLFDNKPLELVRGHLGVLGGISWPKTIASSASETGF